MEPSLPLFQDIADHNPTLGIAEESVPQYTHHGDYTEDRKPKEGSEHVDFTRDAEPKEGSCDVNFTRERKPRDQKISDDGDFSEDSNPKEGSDDVDFIGEATPKERSDGTVTGDFGLKLNEVKV